MISGFYPWTTVNVGLCWGHLCRHLQLLLVPGPLGSLSAKVALQRLGSVVCTNCRGSFFVCGVKHHLGLSLTDNS